MEFASVSTEQGYRTTINARTHTWNGDMPLDADGTDTAPNPEELLLGALGSCTTMTLHLYANRKGWNLQRVHINLELEKVKAEDYPDYSGDAKFVNLIRQNITLEGELDETQRARLMDIAGRCPVHRILDGPTITREFEVK